MNRMNGKKLALRTQTVRNLDASKLGGAHGGLSGPRGATTRDLPCPATMVVLNTCMSAGDCPDDSAYPSLGC